MAASRYDGAPQDFQKAILAASIAHYPDQLDCYLTLAPETYDELSKTTNFPSHVYRTADHFLVANSITTASVALYESRSIPQTLYTLEFIAFKTAPGRPIKFSFDVDQLHAAATLAVSHDITIPLSSVISLCSNYIEPQLSSCIKHWQVTKNPRPDPTLDPQSHLYGARLRGKRNASRSPIRADPFADPSYNN